MKCCICHQPCEDTICESCWQRLISERDDLYDIVFLSSEIASCRAAEMDNIFHNIKLLGEVFTRLYEQYREEYRYPGALQKAEDQFRQEHIIHILRKHGGSRTEAAKELGIGRTYLTRLITNLGLRNEIDE